MTYVMEVPVEAGGQLLVQIDGDDLPDDLAPAALRRPGEIIACAKESVEDSLDKLKPAISAVTERFRSMAADEVTVEFGIMLSAEGNAIIAKGHAEVHFTVTFAWNRAEKQGTQPSERPGK